MKNISEITTLFDVYGSLLSKKKQIYIKKYYFEDLSLKEIADVHNVSRAAIHLGIQNAIKELHYFENKIEYIHMQNMRLDFYNNEINDIELKKALLALEFRKK